MKEKPHEEFLFEGEPGELREMTVMQSARLYNVVTFHERGKPQLFGPFATRRAGRSSYALPFGERIGYRWVWKIWVENHPGLKGKMGTLESEFIMSTADIALAIDPRELFESMKAEALKRLLSEASL
jgi:hypothetical protein